MYSSKNSAFLERAFSLDENGNFVIPLGDLALLNMSSEFLQSIVKNAVSKIKLPGKALVSCTSFGVANKLKVEFEYDELNDPIAYKGIDCLLPAWSEDIIASCVDEQGHLDFEKIKKQAPELFTLLGNRIPTQFKNFILPLHCVGFLPTIMGNTIITAMDSVALQDADFDNDKIVTFFPNTSADYYEDNWKDKIYEAYKEYTRTFYMYEVYSTAKEKMYKSGDELLKFYRKPDAPEGKLMSFSQYKEMHRKDYLRKDGPKISYIATTDISDISKLSDAQIDNVLVKTMIGMLTSPAVATQSLASGSTAALKKIKKEIEELRPKNRYPDGPADISTRINYETRNNDGKQMIAVMANAESLQAIAQNTKLKLKDYEGVTINGRKLTSLHDVQIENSLTYISKYIGELLGAAADNAKDPMLSVFNINLTTAPVVSLMLMLGYTVEETALFLNIPSIRQYTDTGYSDFKIKNLGSQILPGDLSDMKKTISFDGTISDMDSRMREYNEQALGVYLSLQQAGEQLRTLSSLVRGDSGATMPHGPIENIFSRILLYDQFIEQQKSIWGVFENIEDILDIDYDAPISKEHVDNAKNPIAQAYLDYGVVASYQFLKEYYPCLADKNFRDTIRVIIEECYNGRITAKTVKPIMQQLMAFVQTQYDCMCKEGLSFEASRDYYINEFPQECLRIISKYPAFYGYRWSTMFRHLNFYCPIIHAEPFITFRKQDGETNAIGDFFARDWTQMFYYKNYDDSINMELRQLGVELFKHCFYRNGFAFSVDTFAHLAPAEARLFFPGYMDMFEQMKKPMSAEDYKEFRVQYLRNHLYDSRVCGVRSKGAQLRLIENGEIMGIITLPNKNYLDSRYGDNKYDWYFTEVNGHTEGRAAFAQYSGDKLLYYVKASYNKETGETTYVLTTPLGWDKKATEYSAKEDAFAMLSIYDQSVVEKSIKTRKRKKKKRLSTI